ncbi:hypothetical protein A3D77_04680 [Candidatus Gottesmanbacteria bacterium RIFCSPHIGHO2_02_FULL_39_11]|uniref:Methyltransferase type 11 n=1 Tax=Candidatus Gottesmanbacteria bacterium RIFCSPHIGHO2_02_FULL_39_11 TaxID=1798382 RepID=A0A1F5ZJV7_9BACT|nr:MAG: hypothetical protein A3D77_04680 [Candidatus Gottesmanbacteria bacterium RIFCSPHIGHO2_02_FULL_39_11]
MKIICPLCSFTKGVLEKSKGKYKLYRCNKCELVFVYPLPNESELNKYYEKFNYSLGFESENQIRKDSNKTLISLKYLMKTGKKLLDIGCGAGFFLDEARKKGFIVEGTDMSNEVIRYARDRLKLKVFRGNFNSINIDKLKKNRYDAITLIQFIEHITSPHRIIENVYSILKPDGIICIVTPNINGWLYKILKSEYNYLIPPEHVIYYSSKTLSKLLNFHKLKPIKVETWGYPDDMYRIITKLVRGTLQSEIKTQIPSRDIMVTWEKRKESIRRKILNGLCDYTYPLLNIAQHGSMIEIYAKKIS